MGFQVRISLVSWWQSAQRPQLQLGRFSTCLYMCRNPELEIFPRNTQQWIALISLWLRLVMKETSDRLWEHSLEMICCRRRWVTRCSFLWKYSPCVSQYEVVKACSLSQFASCIVMHLVCGETQRARYHFVTRVAHMQIMCLGGHTRFFVV